MDDSKRKRRVVLVHPHEVLRDGLCVLIERHDDFQVVASVGDTAEALQIIEALLPDLVIAGSDLPGRLISEFMADVSRLAGCRKLVLSRDSSEGSVRAALLAGADAFVDLNASLEELITAMRSACGGRNFVCNTIATRILSSYFVEKTPVPPGGPTTAITVREKEVLIRVALGSSNKAIARELGLSPKTVEKHRSNLMRKLQLHNAAAITMYAIRNGITSSDPFGNKSQEASPLAAGVH
jgi:DNA-binding NarL/FixJ family response regulator